MVEASRIGTCAGKWIIMMTFVMGPKGVWGSFQSGFFFRHPLLDPYDYYW